MVTLSPPCGRVGRGPGLALLVIILAVACPLASSAQGPIRAWGMGGAQTAAARGLAAVDFNPAGLAFSRGSTLGLPTAAIMVGNNSLSLDRYNEITGRYLDTAAKNRLMADIPSGGFSLNADVRVSVVGYQWGHQAFSLGARGQGRGNLDRDYFDLALFGNEMGQTVDFSQTWGGGYAVGSATFSWGTPLFQGSEGILAAGCNLHYLQGIYEIHVERAGGSVNTAQTGLDGQAYVDALSADGGQGYGVDLGLIWQRGAWDLAVAIDNTIARINWNRGLQEDAYAVTATAVTLLDGNLDTAVLDSHKTTQASPYHTRLPRTYRVGVAHTAGPLMASGDLVREEGFTAGQPVINRAALGAEYRLASWLTPRAGLRFDSTAGVGGALGLGIGAGTWHLDAAAMTTGGVLPSQAKGFGVAVGTYLVF